jgi:nucleotide-binding universal stress UspA family protein
VARRKLVIGFNGAPQGEDALALGRVLGEALEATAAVAIVVHYPRGAHKDADPEAACAAFCAPLFAKAHGRLGDLRTLERPLVHESPANAMYELADELDANLTVLGSAHHGPAGQVLLGGVGESMLAGAPSGIAVAPRGYADGNGHLARIGVAVDGSPQSLRALQAATTLAAPSDATIEVLHVLPQHHYVLGGALSPLGPEEYDEFKRKEAEALLRRAVEQVPEDLETRPVLLEGEPVEALAGAARDLDLLVLGSRGYGPLKGALLGSVSSKLIRSAPCPVVVLPKGTGPDPLGA